MRQILPAMLLAISASIGNAAQSADETRDRRLSVDDYFRIVGVAEASLSPDGDWIAWTQTRGDLEADESTSQIFMAPAGGGAPIAMTAQDQSSSHPRWSPDGRYLAFLSARGDDETQVWTLNRHGGEAQQLTDTVQSVSTFQWSPGGDRMVLVLRDPRPEQLARKEEGEDYQEKSPGPWVIDREHFKQDYTGYLDRRRTHLYLFDLENRETVQITSGDFDDSGPAWSPDGTRIAFVSNRTARADLNENSDIWVVPATAPVNGVPAPQRVTDNPGTDDAPAWSPDGRWLAHRATLHADKAYYRTAHLAASRADGSDFKVLTRELDRMVFEPRFQADGRILFLLEDSGEQNLARVGLDGQGLERLLTGQDVVRAFEPGPGGRLALTLTRPQAPAEAFVLEQGGLVQRSFANREVLAELELGEVVDVRYTSADGTEIEAFVTLPPDFRADRKYPTLLDIHGGPQSQDDWGFGYAHQLWAAHGYVVLSPNFRGSTGYGEAHTLGIWQNWGGPDYEDVMAGIDHLVGLGWADPERLGVTGWSYGGMLTNHVITKTGRFKAAVTGASATLYTVNYGHDQYIVWWEQELGFPWEPESRALYEALSPFNQVQNVTTPTLILGGEKDWNVPIINSEQLYLALKRLGVDTELVVYPGEYHGIDLPSHAKDLFQRYLDWFDRYL